VYSVLILPVKRQKISPARPEESSLTSLANLPPECQGDVDLSLIEENLRLSPAQRIQAASQATTDLEHLRAALKARHA
jgi:hypothetical protein